MKEEVAKTMLKKCMNHDLILEMTGLDQAILHKLESEMKK